MLIICQNRKKSTKKKKDIIFVVIQRKNGKENTTRLLFFLIPHEPQTAPRCDPKCSCGLCGFLCYVVNGLQYEELFRDRRDYLEEVVREALLNSIFSWCFTIFFTSKVNKIACRVKWHKSNYCIPYFFPSYSSHRVSGLIQYNEKEVTQTPEYLEQLFFYYPSDEYISYLMTVDELLSADEIDCRDLFPGDNARERIIVFEIGDI